MNKKMKEFCKKKLEDPGYHKEIKWYNLFSPIIILLGPNGTGKSTSLRLMQEELEQRKDTKVIKYSTTNDDIVRKYSGMFFKPEALVSAFHSEGERMSDSFFDWCEKVMVPEVLRNKSELYIFIDEADSGLSLDKIHEQFQDILYIMKEEVKRGHKVHLVITANSYELAEVFKDEYKIASYIWVPTGDYITLGSYNSYKKRYLEYYKEMNFDENGERRS